MESTTTTHHEEEEFELHPPDTILFIFLALLLGAVLRAGKARHYTTSLTPPRHQVSANYYPLHGSLTTHWLRMGMVVFDCTGG